MATKKPAPAPPLFQTPESANAATSPKGPDQPAGTASTGMTLAQRTAAANEASGLSSTGAQVWGGPPGGFPTQPPESANAATSPKGPDQPALPGAVPVPGATIQPSATTPITPGATASELGNQLEDKTALATIETTLQQYGFSGQALQQLTQFVWNEILNGTPNAQILLDIQNTPQFEQQFPAIKERISAGLPPITPAEYISTLDSYTQSLVQAGISPSQVNLNDLVAKDVSPTELSDRIQQGYVVMSQAPASVLHTLQNYYGIGQGDLLQWATNTGNSEQRILQQVGAAQIGGAAAASGFMGANAQNGQFPVNSALAQQLYGQGVSYQQAQTGFGQLANESQLYTNLPGQGQVRNGYTVNQLAEAQFFGGPAEQQLQQQAAREKANFQAGTALGTSGQQTAAGAFQR